MGTNSLRLLSSTLVYAAAQYYAFVWLNIKHVSIISTRINNSLRFISGALKKNPIQWISKVVTIILSLLEIRRSAKQRELKVF